MSTSTSDAALPRHSPVSKEPDVSGSYATLVLGDMLKAYGLHLATLASIIAFSILRPDAFFSVDNALSILMLAAPMSIAACGVTVALVLNQIDLSVGAMIGLGGAVSVCLMSYFGLPWYLAISAAMAVGLTAGLTTGFIVATSGANALIVTLGMSTVLTGIEFLATDQRTIYTGLDPSYVALGQSQFLGVSMQIWIAAAAGAMLWTLLEKTEAGRLMYAAGSSPRAAFLAGVPVRNLQVTGFVIVALCATLAGILLTAQSASSFPNTGQPYLLPAFASAFLGSTTSADERFTITGTLIAVVFIGVIQTGLTMLQLSSGAINVAQGGLLVGAVLLSALGKRRA